MAVVALKSARAAVYKTIDDYPEMMKVKEVQEYLRIGENATYDFLNHPKCPTFRVGNSIRIRKEKLLQFMDEWENGFEGAAEV